MQNIKIREANKEDIPQILHLVKELAKYEKLSDKVTGTEELYEKNGFSDNQYFQSLIVEDGNKKAIGFALYFFTFSTFTGKPSLYLEDIFILPEYRNQGIGKMLFKKVVKIAKDKDCGRMEWAVLDWNDPSMKFYESMGARAVNEWVIYRLEEKQIHNLV